MRPAAAAAASSAALSSSGMQREDSCPARLRDELRRAVLTYDARMPTAVVEALTAVAMEAVSFARTPTMRAPAAGAPPDVELWVKRADVAGSRYDLLRSSSSSAGPILSIRVADVIHMIARERGMASPLDLITLQLVSTRSTKPSSADEAAAVALEEHVQLGDAVIAAAGAMSSHLLWMLVTTPAGVATSAAAGVTQSPPLLTVADDPAKVVQFAGLVRDDAMTSFYAAAVAASPVSAPDGMKLWRLHEGGDVSKPMQWPLLHQFVLLERDFYVRFYAHEGWLGELSRDGPQRKYAILGQPGIGKSAFGLWLLVQLLRAGRTVVYSRNFAKRGTSPRERHLVFHAGMAFSAMDLWHVQKLCADAAVVHISDSCKPEASTCHQIMLTSSPDPDMWRWFVEKEEASSVYFPVYSSVELEALRAAEFGDALPADVMNLRVRAWGPVPRQVFSTKQVQVRASVLSALARADVDVLHRTMTEISTASAQPSVDSPHVLFLLEADRNVLEPGKVTFRSNAIAMRVVRHLTDHHYDRFLAAIQQLGSSGVTRSLAGTLFEYMVLDRFERGGSFCLRPLHFASGPDVAVGCGADASSSDDFNAGFIGEKLLRSCRTSAISPLQLYRDEIDEAGDAGIEMASRHASPAMPELESNAPEM